MSHQCPGPGCTLAVSDDMLACRRHWFQVSKAIRDEVWSAWRALLRARAANAVHDLEGSDHLTGAEQRHDLAMAAAIAEMKP